MRLFYPAEPVETVVMRGATQRSPVQISLGWQDTGHEVKKCFLFVFNNEGQKYVYSIGKPILFQLQELLPELHTQYHGCL